MEPVPISIESAIAAYTIDNKIFIPRYHSPTVFASHLFHETGHVIVNNHLFGSSTILHPDEILTQTIDLSKPRKRILTELFMTNQPGNNWHGEVIELMYQSLPILTKDTFNPEIIDLTIVESKAEFTESLTGLDFRNSGVITEQNRRIAIATQIGHQTEVPAYYMQFAGGIFVENTLTTDPQDPISIHLGCPQLPTHKAAYTSVEELYLRGDFPTRKKIKRRWNRRLKAA